MVFGTQIPLVLLKHRVKDLKVTGTFLPHLPHQGLRQTAGADPTQSTGMSWEHRAGPCGVCSPPQIHQQCTGAEREKAKDRGFSSDTQETSVHFQSLASQRPSCGDANTVNLTQKNNN